MKTFLQFFSGDDDRMSMTRLLMFGSFIISAEIMVHLEHCGKMSEGYFTIFLATFAASYAGGKYIDSRTTIKTTEAQAAATAATP